MIVVSKTVSSFTKIENNPFLTVKTVRKPNTKPTKVLFLYPNERGMSTVPPSIATLSQIVKAEGHVTSLFDTTFYKFDDELTMEDCDQITMKALTNRPANVFQTKKSMAAMAGALDRDDDDLHFKKTTRSAVNDFRIAAEDFKPDIIAVSCTETTFLRGMKIISETRDLGIKNIFGGVFPTFAPDLVMNYEDVDMLCVGEGENTIIDLCNCMSNKEDYSHITNLWLKEKMEL